MFTLPKASLIEFVVVQVSPECRRVGRFRVRGRKGVNRVVFKGRVGRTMLSPGTYRIRANASGRRVVDTRLVVVSRRDAGEIASARTADACASSTSASAGPGSLGPAAPTAAPRTLPADHEADTRPSKGVLGSRFVREAVGTASTIPPWLYVMLGVAIALLGVAALPPRAAQSAGAAMLLAHRRGMIAAAGTTALVAVTIAYALH